MTDKTPPRPRGSRPPSRDLPGFGPKARRPQREDRDSGSTQRDKPRSDKPKSARGDREDRPRRDDRPKREGSERRGPPRNGPPRNRRDSGERSERGRSDGNKRDNARGERPRRDRLNDDERGARRDHTREDRSRSDRPRSDRPRRDHSESNERGPRRDREGNDRRDRRSNDGGSRPRHDGPNRDRPHGNRNRDDRNREDRPRGDRPPRRFDRDGDQPRSDRPSGDRPRRPRFDDDGDKRPSSRGVRRPKHVRERESNSVRQTQDNRTKNLGARASALAGVMGVVGKGVPLDIGLDGSADYRRLETRDRAFARAIASATIRRSGALNAAIGALVEKPLPAKDMKARMILLCGAAELLVLGSAPHAVVDAWVSLMDQDPDTQRYKNLTNAVLRRVKDQGQAAFDAADPLHDLPEWWADRWVEAYGEDTARAIMRARSGPPPLDISLKREMDRPVLIKALEAESLPTGTIRRSEIGAVDGLPGFSKGQWWVQDAAAALPVKLLAPKAEETIIDLCAAPGGKTLQLAAAGAKVIAVDASAKRLKRLEENLERTGLSAEVVAADAITYRPETPVDAVLIDAPCTATGTLRRRPDASFIKQAGDVDSLVEIQASILDAALEMLKPGGRLIYCTCSLEPEEGEQQIAKLLDARLDVRLDPVERDELPELEDTILADGTVRTRPDHWAEKGGLDGFFIARLIKA